MIFIASLLQRRSLVSRFQGQSRSGIVNSERVGKGSWVVVSGVYELRALAAPFRTRALRKMATTVSSKEGNKKQSNHLAKDPLEQCRVPAPEKWFAAALLCRDARETLLRSPPSTAWSDDVPSLPSERPPGCPGKQLHYTTQLTQNSRQHTLYAGPCATHTRPHMLTLWALFQGKSLLLGTTPSHHVPDAVRGAPTLPIVPH